MQRDARMSWRSDCRGILDFAAHAWVPAGHLWNTRAHFGGGRGVAHEKLSAKHDL